MRPFEAFRRSNAVVPMSRDRRLAMSLMVDSDQRLAYFLSQELSESNCKFVFENVYEAVRECLDALLALEGYKSFSHQASIAFAKDRSILSAREARMLDRLREIRNRSKYYGDDVSFAIASEEGPLMHGMAKQLRHVLLQKLRPKE